MHKFDELAERQHAKRKKRKASVSPAKAKEILRHGEVRGHRLTPAQKRFFGARAGASQ